MRLRARSLLTATVLVCLTAVPFDLGAQERTLHIGLTQEPGTLNPIVATLAVETDVDELVFSGLIRYDERGNRIPDLAKEVPSLENGGISRDGKTITYHLVRNAKWQDGVPVTSEDVKFTYSALRNPKNLTVGAAAYEQIDRVEAPDPYTVRIVLKRPWAPTLDAFRNGNQGSIIPAHLLAKYEDLNHVDFAGAPVGSGPYRLVAWHRGSDMVFEADPNYFRGPAKIKRVQIRFIPADNTMTIALRTHELDVGDRLNISTYVNLGQIPGMLPAINTQAWWEHLTFNTARPPLDDRRVRLALCHGFDVDEIYAKIAHGLGMLGSTTQNPATMWFNRNVHYYRFDQKRASQILAAAGWEMGADGIRVKNGKPLTLSIVSTTGNITREQTEVILQQRWRSIGVDLVIKNGPAATVFALAANGGPLYSGNYDVALSSFINAQPDPSNWNVNSGERIPPHGNNISFLNDPELTRLELEGASTFVVSKRKALYDQEQEVEHRLLPTYTIRWQAITDMRSADLVGVKPPVVSSTFWNIADWHFAR